MAIYLLFKLEGRDKLNEHPLIERLCKIKLLLEKMRPLDQKLNYQIELN